VAPTSEGSQEQQDWKKEFADRLVFFPVGIASAVISAAPTAAETGKRLIESQVKSMEFMGKMTAEYLKRRAGSPEDVIREAAKFVGGAASGRFGLIGDIVGSVLNQPSPDVQANKGSQSSSSEATETTAEPVEEESTNVGGIEGYDGLTASQAIAQFDERSDEELSAIESYELAHRRRRTVLGKISSLREARSSN
jgi:hypothetical protein